MFMDMNEHILWGGLAKYLLNMGLQEATQTNWGSLELHTYGRGTEPIDGVWFLPELEITSTIQLSFHEGVGEHRTVLVDVSTVSAIGKYEFRMVQPHARQLSSTNIQARTKYLAFLERQMQTHWIAEGLHACVEQITLYPVPPVVQHQMQIFDKQTVEMQRGGKRQCRQVFAAALPFSEPIWVIHFQRRAYQALSRRDNLQLQRSKVVKQALKAGIPTPRILTLSQCLDGVEACTRRMKVLKGQVGGLWWVHLRGCLIWPKDAGNELQCTGILRTIEQEEKKGIWHRINRAIDDPSLGAVPFVQRMENGHVIDIQEVDKMNREIQVTTEKRFDLWMSTPITMSSLRECLGFLSNTEFVMNMLRGGVHIPADVDDATTIVIEEIMRLFQALHKGHAQVSLEAAEFGYYWKRVQEKTSLAISTIHFGHYKLATYLETSTDFLAKKITLIARGGCSPDIWGMAFKFY
jgi:hypothetical protein